MTIKEYSKAKRISLKKASLIAEYYEGRGTKTIDEHRRAIYIPDKRCYNDISKNYCYVLDAIVSEMDLVEELSLISNDVVQTIVHELARNQLISLKKGCDPNSDNHLDYIPSLRLIKWRDKKAKEKTQLIMNMINAFANIVHGVGGMIGQ